MNLLCNEADEKPANFHYELRFPLNGLHEFVIVHSIGCMSPF